MSHWPVLGPWQNGACTSLAHLQSSQHAGTAILQSVFCVPVTHYSFFESDGAWSWNTRPDSYLQTLAFPLGQPISIIVRHIAWHYELTASDTSSFCWYRSFWKTFPFLYLFATPWLKRDLAALLDRGRGDSFVSIKSPVFFEDTLNKSEGSFSIKF